MTTADYGDVFTALAREIEAARLDYDEKQHHVDGHGYCHCDAKEPVEMNGLDAFTPITEPAR